MKLTVNNLIKTLMDETMKVSICSYGNGDELVSVTRKDLYETFDNWEYEDVSNCDVLRWKVEENKVIVFI